MRIPSAGSGPIRADDPHRDLDRRIAEAVSPEKIRNNPFRGKPLRLDHNPFEGDWSVAYRLVRQAGHRLPWMDLQHEILQRLRSLHESIEAHRAWLQAHLETLSAEGCTADDKAAVQRVHDRFVAQLTEQVADLRRKISDFNLKVPLPHLQIRNVRVETYLNDLAAATAGLLAALQALPERPAPRPARPASGGMHRWVLYAVIGAGLLLLAVSILMLPA
ncbi:MAG TPA: hypothetical protein VF282_08575 [Bacillota bacterium]